MRLQNSARARYYSGFRRGRSPLDASRRPRSPAGCSTHTGVAGVVDVGVERGGVEVRGEKGRKKGSLEGGTPGVAAQLAAPSKAPAPLEPAKRIPEDDDDDDASSTLLLGALLTPRRSSRTDAYRPATSAHSSASRRRCASTEPRDLRASQGRRALHRDVSSSRAAPLCGKRARIDDFVDDER